MTVIGSRDHGAVPLRRLWPSLLLCVAGALCIGVNARNLKTLDVDLATFGGLSERIGPGAVRVAESGIFTAADVATVAAQGADAILVGEALVRHGDPIAAIAGFIAAAERARA